MDVMIFSKDAICLIWFFYSLPHFPPLLCFLSHVIVSFVFLLRIRQAKVQILPERILPDPLSAVRLTPLSRLHIQPASEHSTQSSEQAQCWWNHYQQVRKTHVQQSHTACCAESEYAANVVLKMFIFTPPQRRNGGIVFGLIC